ITLERRTPSRSGCRAGQWHLAGALVKVAAGSRARRRLLQGQVVLELDNHRLGLEVVGEDFLAHLAAPAALFEATERQLRAVHVVGVDPHGARLETLGELVGL